MLFTIIYSFIMLLITCYYYFYYILLSLVSCHLFLLIFYLFLLLTYLSTAYIFLLVYRIQYVIMVYNNRLLTQDLGFSQNSQNSEIIAYHFMLYHNRICYIPVVYNLELLVQVAILIVRYYYVWCVLGIWPDSGDMAPGSRMGQVTWPRDHTWVR